MLDGHAFTRTDPGIYFNLTLRWSMLERKQDIAIRVYTCSNRSCDGVGGSHTRCSVEPLLQRLGVPEPGGSCIPSCQVVVLRNPAIRTILPTLARGGPLNRQPARCMHILQPVHSTHAMPVLSSAL